MNKYKIIIIILLVVLVAPSIALASWWNPFSWHWSTTKKASCEPNWNCVWGPCTNGYQSQIAKDSNNCKKAKTSPIACPALAKACGKQTKNINQQYKSCNSGTTWDCKGVSHGANYGPNYVPPQVCGCFPDNCPSGESMIINGTGEFWPDGTQKGSYVCSTSGPPSAANK